MSYELTVRSATKRFEATLPTAHGQLIEKVITGRLSRGLSTPFYMETPDGHQSELVKIHSHKDYAMTFIADGKPSATAERLEIDSKEADRIIEERGYIRLTTEDLSS